MFVLLVTTFGLVNTNALSEEDYDNDIVVVVNVNNTINELSKKEVIDNFMGRFATFPDGKRVEPLDYPAGTELRKSFYQLLVDKDERKIKAYWSRLLFSGRASPPRKLDDVSTIVSEVETNEYALAFIPRKDVTEKMKVVYDVK